MFVGLPSELQDHDGNSASKSHPADDHENRGSQPRGEGERTLSGMQAGEVLVSGRALPTQPKTSLVLYSFPFNSHGMQIVLLS